MHPRQQLDYEIWAETYITQKEKLRQIAIELAETEEYGRQHGYTPPPTQTN
jgi:hypothetical protein